jgi:predicted secreted protein
MMPCRLSSLACFLAAMAVAVPAAFAQEPPPPTMQPAATVNASATASIANDRMQAWLRVEAENPDAAAAASSVNIRMAAALTRAKASAGVDSRTLGYSTQQIVEKGQPTRWRAVQTLSLESADFSALSALVSRLQASDGLLLSGLQFSVAAATRRKAEDQLIQDAIRAWQQRAQQAAQGFGFPAWRVGRVTIQTNDYSQPQPMLMRAQAAPFGGGAPVATEAGTTDVTVTVSGDAILEGPRLQTR